MRKYVLLLSVLTLAGCDLGPGPVQPKISMPAAWQEQSAAAATAWPAADWWRSFGSDELNRLVVEAQANNLDIAAAAARVNQAEAQLRVTGASLFPLVNFTSGLEQRGPAGDPKLIEGGRSSTLAKDLGGGSGSSKQRSSASVGLSASYELDFWGKNRDNVNASKAALQSSQFDRETVALTVTSGVASTYLQIMTLKDRIALAQQNLANAQTVLKVVESKARNGAVSGLDLAQQQSQVSAQQAAIPPLELQEKQATNALALLLGRNPEDLKLT